MRPELKAKFAAAQALQEGATDLQATMVEAITLEQLGVPVFDEDDIPSCRNCDRLGVGSGRCPSCGVHQDGDQYGWGDKIGAWE